MNLQIKNTGIALITAILLLLSWAALDDITTGRQPHFFPEYAMLAITASWLIFLLWKGIPKKPITSQHP